MDITKKMLNTLRKNKDEQAKWAAEQFVMESEEKDNFLTRSKILMEEAVQDKKKVLTENEQVDNEHKQTFEITKNTPQFGDVRISQEEAIRKTLNTNVQFEENALKYYPNADDMTLDGKIPSLNAKFQFRFNDPSNMGSYLWCEALQLSDENVRILGKVFDAYKNWQNSIIQDGDLMEKLKRASENKEE